MTKRVLTVDDSKTMLQMLQFALKQGGFEVIQGENGQEGLDLLEANTVDVIITDINMPVMDGITALQAIRQGRAGDPRLPVIALTASAMAGDRERFLGMGFDDHLGKPVKPMDLITAIVRAVSPEPPNEGLQAA